MCDFLKTPCNSPLYGCSTIWASQVALVVKNPRVIARGEDWIPGRGRFPAEPTPVFLPGKFYKRRSLVSYSPWDSKESDITEHMLQFIDPFF